MGFSERKVMYTSLFDTFFSDSLIAPTRTVYVVSDSQLEELKRNQRQEELDNIEDSRKRLEESYQARIKFLDERQNEIKEELKALSPTNVKAALKKGNAEERTEKTKTEEEKKTPKKERKKKKNI